MDDQTPFKMPPFTGRESIVLSTYAADRSASLEFRWSY
jgi:hypothetical protein